MSMANASDYPCENPVRPVALAIDSIKPTKQSGVSRFSCRLVIANGVVCAVDYVQRRWPTLDEVTARWHAYVRAKCAGKYHQTACEIHTVRSLGQFAQILD